MEVGTGAGEMGAIVAREPKYQKVTKEQVAEWIKEETGKEIKLDKIKEIKSTKPDLQVFTAKVKKKRKKLVCWVHLGLKEHNISYIKM